jgi:DMSO/TMAO reductase YedYZ heme-binding membrane subunit
MLGFVFASAAILHTLFATRINEIGGLVFFAVLTIAYLLLKRRRQAP